MENPDMEEPQCSQGAEKETIQTEQVKASRHKRRSPSPSQLSMKSDDSMIQPVHFTSGKRVRKASSSPGQLSLKGDDDSMIQPVHFGQEEQQEQTGFRKVSPSEVVTTEVIATGDVEPNLCQEHYKVLDMFCKTDQAAICKGCAVKQHKEHAKQYIKISTVPNTLITLQNILDRMTASEFREFKRNLGYEYPECFETLPNTRSTRKDIAESMMESFSEDEVLKVTVNLASIKPVSRCQEKIKETLRRKFWHVHEGLALPKTQVVLYDTYTELYITEGGSDAVKAEHEVRLIEKVDKNCSNQENPVNLTGIFRSPSGDVRTVLTKGIAGIGKTISVQKFMLDWAENSANQDIDLIIPLFFRDLNLEKEPCSLIELMRKFFSELKEIESFENGIKILLVLDGLDECRIHLDFHNTRTCCDIMEPISMDVLLTNLIKGNLLPKSLLWITSRPAATNQIPSECVQRVTEVRGFSDPQKEEYFHKKCKDPHMANLMIKHVKSSRSMHIMCHIPIFCWITATVLDILIRDSEIGEIPKNQTQLYIHYLLIQTGLKNRKYQKAINGDLRKLTQSDKSMILNLAKLAFQGMTKNTLIFYEADLKDCGIDINDAAEFSSLCTQLFREEFGLYRERVFCFLHLSIQEHLAAIYVLNQCLTEGMNVLASSGSQSTKQNQKTTLTNLLKSAVIKALENKFGHFDQFLRFFLGLSTECNRQLLQNLLPQIGKESLENDKIVQFIKDKIAEEARTETETINLIHCLKELGDIGLVNEIQESLDSGTICDMELNPVQCSVLAYIILMSKDVMEVFDLKKYKTTQASSRHRLLPIVRASKKAILCDCELSRNSCEIVASGLRIANSPVRELDLSHNPIGNDGFLDLCKGLKSPHCQLEILRLEACEITDKSCANLAFAFKSTPSSLQELDLSSNELTDEGVMMLEPWLKSENCKVQRLRLKQCRLTKSYCKHLAEVLTSSSTKKINLDLTGNDLED
ncbi:protein NLRC3-like isoform X3 [Silurus meridionalis]|uniref:protein NLRC3-like isoform X3 n=1 Tax=Silurus meridionalis TaxID=175797 RepID=UPI001EEA000D|nr:protein NLRC3-like isoform X3 [Silurus meridionalis]